jgi:hypothetical protein
MAIVLLAGTAAAVGASRHASKISLGLPDEINNLARQLDGEPYYDAGQIPGQIQKLVLGSLTAWMNQNRGSEAASPYPIDVRIRMQLENDFSKLHYPWFGRPAIFVRSWNGKQLLGTGYTLGWSDFDRVNCVAIFERGAGKTEMAAVTNFVPQADLHYAFLPASPNGDFRFFVYGYLLGKSQPRLTAILYSFDGKALKNLWERQDIYDGKMDVTPGAVTLRYLVEDEYVQAVQRNQLPPGHEAIYRVTPQGLALETDREIAYRDVVLR